MRELSEKVVRSEGLTGFISDHSAHIERIDGTIESLRHNINILYNLSASVKESCKTKDADIMMSLEAHLMTLLHYVIAEDSRNSNASFHFFYQWLDDKFGKQKNLTNEEIVSVLKSFKGTSEIVKEETEWAVQNIIRTAIPEYMDQYIKNMAENLNQMSPIVAIDEVKKIVKEAIMVYDADKTGLVDFALESGGGSVVGTRCSETYIEGSARFTIFGLPIWHFSNSPRTAIQAEVHPGQCWAIKGTQGFLVLQLSDKIFPTGFVIEHIPLSISPSESIDSAPKDFSVWGLTSEKDMDGKLLGRFVYNINGEPLQHFPVQGPNENSFSLIELRIHSNNGNPEYTCLYRFRVHGSRA